MACTRPAGYHRDEWWKYCGTPESTEEPPTSDEEEDMQDEDTFEYATGEDESEEQIGEVETVGVDREELPSCGGMTDAHAGITAEIAAPQNNPVHHRRHNPGLVHRRRSPRLQSDPVQPRCSWRDHRFNYYRIQQARTFSK